MTTEKSALRYSQVVLLGIECVLKVNLTGQRANDAAPHRGATYARYVGEPHCVVRMYWSNCDFKVVKDA
jgi:hypothetical protein